MLAADADLLTRTTLKVDPSLAAASLADMIGALQRVPGVLFAEANAAQTCVVVAHDAAVPTMPLAAAAEATGVSVDISPIHDQHCSAANRNRTRVFFRIDGRDGG